MNNNRHNIHAYTDGVTNTIGGQLIDYNNPTAEMIHIEDIATALSHTCRFGGHVRQFYSVAQHCVLVAMMMKLDGNGSGELVLEGLLHDASEAYLGDVIKPLKELIAPVYAPIERRFEAVIAERFELQDDPIVRGIIKEYDVKALELEHWALQCGNPKPLIEMQERCGIYLGYITNSSGIAKGLFDKIYLDYKRTV